MPTAEWNQRWAMVLGRGFKLVEHDRALLDHSNIVVIRKPA
jgi:hypothetical protein